MCGRYSLSSSGESIAEVLGLEEAPEWSERFNIAPAQEALVCRARDGARRCEPMIWGFEPRESGRRGLINARSETAADKPTFARSFAERRALVPADGFYEWQRRGPQRVAHHFRLRDGSPFAMAGLWRPGRDSSGAPASPRFVVLTTEANDCVAPVHDRMPVILDAAALDRWLDPEIDTADRLLPLLRPLPAERMESWIVSDWVNSAFHEGPRCRERSAPPPEQTRLF
jgi:putative SOS response-associated peptidase YedK